MMEKWAHNITHKLADGVKHLDLDGSSSNDSAVGQTYEIRGRRYRIARLLAEDTTTGEEVALKRVIIQDEDHLRQVRKEIGFLDKLGTGKGVIKFLGANQFRRQGGGTEFIIVTEYCPGGTVLDLMYSRERNKLSGSEILRIFKEICLCVAAMHSQNPPIAHRDLKVENVLRTRGNNLVLCDFGSATTEVYNLSNRRERLDAEEEIGKNTTLIYRAPEMVDFYRQQIIDTKVDIWSLGCLLYKMMFYSDPFDGKLGIMNARYRIPDSSPYDKDLHDLIAYLLTADPAQRPDIFDVLERLGSPVPRPQNQPAKRQQQPTAEVAPPRTSSPKPTAAPSPTTPSRSSPAAAIAGGSSLFEVLDWHTSDFNGTTGHNNNRHPHPAGPKERLSVSEPVPRRHEITAQPKAKSTTTTTSTTTATTQLLGDDEFCDFVGFNTAPAPKPQPSTSAVDLLGLGDFQTTPVSPSPPLLHHNQLSLSMPAPSPSYVDPSFQPFSLSQPQQPQLIQQVQYPSYPPQGGLVQPQPKPLVAPAVRSATPPSLGSNWPSGFSLDVPAQSAPRPSSAGPLGATPLPTTTTLPTTPTYASPTLGTYQPHPQVSMQPFPPIVSSGGVYPAYQVQQPQYQYQSPMPSPPLARPGSQPQQQYPLQPQQQTTKKEELFSEFNIFK